MRTLKDLQLASPWHLTQSITPDPVGRGASQAEPEGSGIIAALLGSLLLSIQMQSQALKLKQKTKDIKTPNV